MRRTVAFLLVIALLAVGAAQAGAALQVDPRATRLLQTEASGNGCAKELPVMVARAGNTYCFLISYEGSGAPSIVTGHDFSIENAFTGLPVATTSRRFEPQPPKGYDEWSSLMIPADAGPGVYRFRWTLWAETDTLPRVESRGDALFLLAPSATSP